VVRSEMFNEYSRVHLYFRDCLRYVMLNRYLVLKPDYSLSVQNFIAIIETECDGFGTGGRIWI
jgi:hypothetical protein